MQTIGERLEEARKRKGISIREAAEATKIRGDYLQKFESNQFDCNLAELYVRGFLRSYAQFLKLPADKIVNDFNGLGHGTRPRQPSREVYGRMDLSVARNEEDAAQADASGGGAGASEPVTTPARRTPGSFTRGGGGNLPSGPMIDPNLVIKGGIVLVIIAVIVLGVWVVKSLMGSAPVSSTNRNNPAPVAPTPQAPANALKPYIFVAVGPISKLQINRKKPDGSWGELLFDQELQTGGTITVPRPGPFYFSVSPAQNLQIELDGKRTSISEINQSGDTITDAKGVPVPAKGYQNRQIE